MRRSAHALGFIYVLVASTEAVANPCFAEVCYASTAKDFIEALPSEEEYSVIYSGQLKQVKLSAPVELIGLPFQASWSQADFSFSKDANTPSLHFEYEFHPRSGTVCRERYEALVKNLSVDSVVDAPFTPGFRPSQSNETIVTFGDANYGLRVSEDHRIRSSKAYVSDTYVLVVGSDAPELRADRNCSLYVRVAPETDR